MIRSLRYVRLVREERELKARLQEVASMKAHSNPPSATTS